MNSESYINRSISIKLQNGSDRRAVSSNFKSGWLHDERIEHKEFGDWKEGESWEMLLW